VVFVFVPSLASTKLFQFLASNDGVKKRNRPGYYGKEKGRKSAWGGFRLDQIHV
jgi:hypothetical protein